MGKKGSAGPPIADVNKDGTADLILPAHGYDVDVVPSPNGSVYVLFGGAGLMAGGDSYASPPNGTTGLHIDCPYASYYLGR
jgi:hypothetical protein